MGPRKNCGTLAWSQRFADLGRDRVKPQGAACLPVPLPFERVCVGTPMNSSDRGCRGGGLVIANRPRTSSSLSSRGSAQFSWLNPRFSRGEGVQLPGVRSGLNPAEIGGGCNGLIPGLQRVTANGNGATKRLADRRDSGCNHLGVRRHSFRTGTTAVRGIAVQEPEHWHECKTD